MALFNKDFITRATTGLGFMLVMLGMTWYNEYTFTALYASICGLALYEFFTLTLSSGRATKLFYTILGVIGYLSIVFCFSSYVSAFVPIAALFVIWSTVFISTLMTEQTVAIKDLSRKLWGYLYVLLPMSLLHLMIFTAEGSFTAAYVIGMLFMTWATDSGAYLFGRLFGKTPLSPVISPNKTWEGAIGGAVMSTIFGIISWSLVQDTDLFFWIGFAIVVTVFGILGDLIESILKRSLDIKDSGNFLPGHGGVLDRFDSFIFIVPHVVIYMYAYRFLF